MSTETEFFLTTRREIDENQTKSPITFRRQNQKLGFSIVGGSSEWIMSRISYRLRYPLS